jgi:hypothetical protein
MTSYISGNPNTGTIAIADALYGNAKLVYATGFDFFRSKWVPGHEIWSSPFAWHDMASQIKYLRKLHVDDSRFKIDDVLKDVLYNDNV